MKIRSCPLIACALTLGLTGNHAVAKPRKNTPVKPNIIYIMCDDMGYGDIGCYGQPYISTPNIDSLAARGMRFTQAYAGSPVSAPSRATLMTGQHSGHTAVRGNKEYWKNVPMVKYGKNEDFSVVGQHPYDTTHVILPEVMKQAGYKTGMFGKWAGGYEGSPSTPDKRGIDEFYGYICQFQAHLYYPNFLNRYRPELGDTSVVRIVLEDNIEYPMFGPEYSKRSQYSADMIHQEALDWLDRCKCDEPFLGIFTYTLPHAELSQPQDSIVETYKSKFFRDYTWGGQEGSRYNPVTHTHAQFAAMITRLDAYVGDIVGLLKQKGLEDNTLIIFTSDNGPHEEGGADPTFFGRDGKLKGIKRSCHEGGIRIPFIVCWPGHVPAGKDNDHILAFYDILPTFSEIAGLPSPSNNYPGQEFDGISFAPTLLGNARQPEHDYLYWEFHETDQIAVRRGPWKLILKKGKPELYNLEKDIHEDTDLSTEYPEITTELTDIIRREHRPSELFRVTAPEPLLH